MQVLANRRKILNARDAEFVELVLWSYTGSE